MKIDRPGPNGWPRKGETFRRESGVFSLLTYNVKNLFDDIDAAKEKGTAAKPVWELNAATKVVQRVDPDLMTNQEVENLDVYQSWNKQLGGQFQTALVEGNDKRGIDVGAMSRYPIVNVVSHKDHQFPLSDGSALTHFSRDLLRVDVQVENEVVSIYTTHSASRRSGTPEEVFVGDNQRIAESMAIKEIVASEMKEFPSRLYIITGDFNDDLQDRALKALMDGPGDRLIDTLADKAPEARQTWPSKPPKNPKYPPGQFDHILIPEKMKDRLIDSQVIDLGQSTATASDHRPILARFRSANSPLPQ